MHVYQFILTPSNHTMKSYGISIKDKPWETENMVVRGLIMETKSPWFESQLCHHFLSNNLRQITSLSVLTVGQEGPMKIRINKSICHGGTEMMHFK